MVILIILTILLARIFWILLFRPKSIPCILNKRSKEQIVWVILGSGKSKVMIIGGHTSEMIKIISPLEKSLNSVHWKYIISSNDSLSESKIQGKGQVYFIPRSRNVKQSFITSIFTTMHAIFYTIPIFYKELPDLIVVNGPGVCIPPCLIAFSLKILGLKHISIVYM